MENILVTKITLKQRKIDIAFVHFEQKAEGKPFEKVNCGRNWDEMRFG